MAIQLKKNYQEFGLASPNYVFLQSYRLADGLKYIFRENTNLELFKMKNFMHILANADSSSHLCTTHVFSLPGVRFGFSFLRRPPNVNENERLKLHFSVSYWFGAGVSLLTFCSGREPNVKAFVWFIPLFAIVYEPGPGVAFMRSSTFR